MADIRQDILEKAKEYDFFQAVLLLEEYFQNRGVDDPLNAGVMVFSPDYSMAFPNSDILNASEQKRGVIQFLLTFMGLVGTSSPLPPYFTEAILYNEERNSALYDFLTIFNHRLYLLFYQAWKRGRMTDLALSSKGGDLIDFFAGIMGLPIDVVRQYPCLIAYSGLFAQKSRSSEGLRVIVSGFFGNIPVIINQWQEQWIPNPAPKSIGSAAQLGKNISIGTLLPDRASKFRIVLGPLEKSMFRSFIPGGENLPVLKKLVGLYCSDYLEFDTKILLKADTAEAVTLGNFVGMMGITAVLGRSDHPLPPFSLIV